MSFAPAAPTGKRTDADRVLLVAPTANTYSTVVGLIAATATGFAVMVTLRPSMSVTVSGYVVAFAAAVAAAVAPGVAAACVPAGFVAPAAAVVRLVRICSCRRTPPPAPPPTAPAPQQPHPSSHLSSSNMRAATSPRRVERIDTPPAAGSAEARTAVARDVKRRKVRKWR